MTEPSRPLLSSRADVATDAPARYAKQLVSHLGRKVDFHTEGDTHTAVVGEATARIVVGDGVLTLVATAPTEAEVDRLRQALGSHLERFGRRNELVVRWRDDDPAAPGSTPTA